MSQGHEYPTELLPWMAEQYEQLVKLHKNGKLAHAYLFGGQQGLGKFTLAKHFAHYLLCTALKDDQPCGECRECQLLAVETHPNLKILQPEDSSEIKIDQVRDTIEFLTMTSQREGYRIVLVSPAEAMNQNAANALLKVLEEPGARTLLILVSRQPALLMATLRSRCHLMKFVRPPVKDVIPWLEAKNVRASAEALLKLANYAPLRALHLADEDALHDRATLHKVLELLLLGKIGIAQAAAECSHFSIEDNIESMMLCTSDILACNQSRLQDDSATLHDSDLKKLAEKLQDRTRIKALHLFYNELVSASRAVKSTSNPNLTLVLESLFYNWATLVR